MNVAWNTDMTRNHICVAPGKTFQFRLSVYEDNRWKLSSTGETINFNWYNNNHNLVEVYTKYNFDNCQVTIYDYLFHNTLHDISYKNTVMKDNNINDITHITNDDNNKNNNRE